jgi:hypothetical protein
MPLYVAYDHCDIHKDHTQAVKDGCFDCQQVVLRSVRNNLDFLSKDLREVRAERDLFKKAWLESLGLWNESR